MQAVLSNFFWYIFNEYPKVFFNYHNKVFWVNMRLSKAVIFTLREKSHKIDKKHKLKRESDEKINYLD